MTRLLHRIGGCALRSAMFRHAHGRVALLVLTVGLMLALASTPQPAAGANGGWPVRGSAGEPSARADLDNAYLEHLRRTKGILDIRTVRQSALGPKGISVVVVSAGFKPEEMDVFHERCRALTKSLFALDPWKRFQSMVNVHAVFVGDAGINDSRLQVAGHDGHVLHCNNPVAVEYANYAADPTGTIVLHNSAYSSAGVGVWGVAVINRGHADNPMILVHELGHGMAGLGDEYIQRSEPFNDPPESLRDTVNVTPEPNPRRCKWHHWTPVEWPGLFSPHVRSEARKIANFEGAGWPTGIYRPEEACIMRCNCNHFCLVCNETMQANFFRYLDLLETVEPAGEDGLLWRGETLEFRVDAATWIRNPAEWLRSRLDLYLDGRRVATSDRGEVVFQLSGDDATPGVHQLGANLNLQCEGVRRDFGFLSANRGWRVTVVPHSRPKLSLPSSLAIAPDAEVDLAVAIEHDQPELFQLRLEHAPEGAVLENGRLRWKPEELLGSWRVDFVVAYQQRDVLIRSMEIHVGQTDDTVEAINLMAPEVIDAVVGHRVAVQLEAKTERGGQVLFVPVDMPTGVVLEGGSGELTWTPRQGQAGTHQARILVRSGAASREAELIFRVRRAAAPTPVAYSGDYIPRTRKHLEQLRQHPAVYRRMFETLRLLRDRYSRIHQPALAEAERLCADLPAELQENILSDLTLHAWAFTDRPAILAWMRRIESKPAAAVDELLDESAALRETLKQIDSYNTDRLEGE